MRRSDCAPSPGSYGKAETTGGDGVDEAELRVRLGAAKVEHRDLDAAIAALAAASVPDQLQLARLKKRKLLLKDEIASLEDRLIPDIIA